MDKNDLQDRLNELAKLIKKEVGIDVQVPSSTDIEVKKALGQTLGNPAGDLKDLLIEKEYLRTVEGFQVPHLLVWNEKAKNDAVSNLMTVFLTTLLACKKMHLVTIRPSKLADLFQEKVAYPFNKAAFIFDEDFQRLDKKLKKELVFLDLELINNIFSHENLS